MASHLTYGEGRRSRGQAFAHSEATPDTRGLGEYLVMLATFVLVHSPSVGPATWRPVAERMTDLGYPTVVPSLLSVCVGRPPYWPRIVSAIAGAVPAGVGGKRVVLVAHSNAGCFMPVAAHALVDSIAGCVFVDARLPALPGPTDVAPPELLSFLESIAVDGQLPRWTDWWEERDIAPMFPDDDIRGTVCAEQPRLPLAYYRQSVPVPSDWSTVPGAYLAFSPAYEPDLTRAVARGWPTDRLAGEHLHQIVDPRAVTDRIITLADTLPDNPRSPRS